MRTANIQKHLVIGSLYIRFILVEGGLVFNTYVGGPPFES